MTGEGGSQPLSAGTEVRAAFEAGEAAAEPTEIPVTDENGAQRLVHVTTVPWGGEQVVLDSEQYEAFPRRRTGVVKPQTVDALVAYTQRHVDSDMTTTWVDMDAYTITSVLNDHGIVDADGVPGWGDHRAVLTLKLTPEWEHWTKADASLMTQEQFAEHIEDGIREVITPDAATMLEIASTFQARTDAQFRQATRLQDGQVQLRYDEETTAKAGTTGQLDVPSVFKLAVSPFLGEPAYEVIARLRYRARGGHLSIGYKLDRPEIVIRDAMENVADRIDADLPAVFIGTPRVR